MVCWGEEGGVWCARVKREAKYLLLLLACKIIRANGMYSAANRAHGCCQLVRDYGVNVHCR